MSKSLRVTATSTLLVLLSLSHTMAQDNFTLKSSEISDGGTLPARLKCIRDGGEGLSPSLQWAEVPDGTESFAVIMHHYPRDKVEGKDAPSQYWLLWNVPADTTEIPLGNPESVGDEGSDKDGRTTGYTVPCSPGGQSHEYTITAYALNAQLSTLPANDSLDVDWTALMQAMEGKVITEASLTFTN